MGRRSLWNIEMIETLRAMERDERFMREVSEAVGMSISACYKKLEELGITRKIPRRGRRPGNSSAKLKGPEYYSSPASDTRRRSMLRPCLRCRTRFPSEGAHNRLCNACRHESASPFDSPARIGQ